MRALSAQPNDVLCGPFDADPEYFIVLTNLERFYWGRPPLTLPIAREFLETLHGATLTVEWRCSVDQRPALVVVKVTDPS